jgi:hypothetical protein
MRVLLCEQKPTSERSLLLNIVQHVLSAEESVAFTIVTPPGQSAQHAVIAMDELEETLVATAPDVLLVLADTIALERARNIAKTHGVIEVIAITRTGYLMIDLDPAKLTAIMRALVEERRGAPPNGRAVANAGTLRIES